ncbi:MAG TPA: alpha/beta hydrolase, partial [Mesorhizobium sp.]|nr:alpha/beta hydrolase [Mesorhizobium sp.]
AINAISSAVLGGTILINTLVEEPPGLELSGIFLLAAPFVGEGGWPSEDIKPMSKLGKCLPAQTPVFAYHGSEDETVPFEHVDLYARAIPQAFVRRFNGRDHQLNNDMAEVAADIRRLG